MVNLDNSIKTEGGFKGRFADWWGLENSIDTIPAILSQLQNILETKNIPGSIHQGLDKSIFFRFGEEPNQEIKDNESVDLDDKTSLINSEGKVVGSVGEREITIVQKDNVSGYTIMLKEYPLGSSLGYSIDQEDFGMFWAEFDLVYKKTY